LNSPVRGDRGPSSSPLVRRKGQRVPGGLPWEEVLEIAAPRLVGTQHAPDGDSVHEERMEAWLRS